MTPTPPNPVLDAVPPSGLAWPTGPFCLVRVRLDHLDKLAGELAGRIRSEAEQRLQAIAEECGGRLALHEGEFLLLLAGEPGAGEAAVQRVLDRLATQPFGLGDGAHLRRTASLGWAPHPWQPKSAGSVSPEAAFGLAGRALWIAIRSGRNQGVGMLPMDDDPAGASVRLVRAVGPDLVDETPTQPLELG